MYEQSMAGGRGGWVAFRNMTRKIKSKGGKKLPLIKGGGSDSKRSQILTKKTP